MTTRRLTEACVFALRAIDEAAPVDIYNRIVAANLRAVERVFPEFVRIMPATDRGPVFSAAITERGREFIRPKKLMRAERRAH